MLNLRTIPSGASFRPAAAGLLSELNGWVEAMTRKLRPAVVHWVTGSEAERERLLELMLRDGSLTRLDPQRYSQCFHLRNTPQDRRRADDRTFLCCRDERDAGPSNNWLDPAYMREQLEPLLEGSLRERVLYVVPYLLGPPGSPLAQAGVQLTDSPYAVLCLRTLARIGRPALHEIERSGRFFRVVHSTGTLDPQLRVLAQFPEERLVLSFGSNHFSSAVPVLESHALRQASLEARQNGWLVAHMSVVAVTSPDGLCFYLGAMMPAGCGKSVLATLVPPDRDLAAGWKLETVSDDVTWLSFGSDRRLYALNPLTGATGPVDEAALAAHAPFQRMSHLDALLTNAPVPLADFGNVSPGEWRDAGDASGAFPWADGCVMAENTEEGFWLAPLSSCPAPHVSLRSGAAVPLSAILLGGRRSTTMPLVSEAASWSQGILASATLTVEAETPSSNGPGAFHFDPLGMRSFCGCHMADWWQHWLEAGRYGGTNMPGLYQVNWFRRDAAGQPLWPGYRENFRVLKWVVDRLRGRGDGCETPVGVVPTAQALELPQSGWRESKAQELLAVKREEWYKEVEVRDEFLARFSTKLPVELSQENAALRKRIQYAPHARSR